MKLAKSVFDGGAALAVERQTSTKNRLDLDDELFSPGAVQSSGADRAVANRLARHGGASNSASRGGSPYQSAGAPLPAIAGAERKKPSPQKLLPHAGFGNSEPRANSDYIEQLDATFDADGRRWPTLLPAPRNIKSELENKIKELSVELTLRCVQIADLCNLRQQQDADLQAARDVIDSLDKSITMLQGAIAKHESEAAAAQQALALANQENTALRRQLEKMQSDSAALLKRSLNTEVAFNDREVAIASVREKVEFLKRDVAAKTMEATSLRATIKEANRRHCDALNQQDVQFRIQIKKLEVMVAERDMQLKELDKAHSELVERCNGLAKTVDSLESTERNAGEKTKSQNNMVELLETLLRVEREAAELKIKDLTVELQRERSQRFATASSSAAARKDIVLLSPKLAARRSRANEHELDTSMSQNNAA